MAGLFNEGRKRFSDAGRPPRPHLGTSRRHLLEPPAGANCSLGVPLGPELGGCGGFDSGSKSTSGKWRPTTPGEVTVFPEERFRESAD